MKDITSRSDIEWVVKTFYNKILRDDLISFLFTDVVKLDLEHHIPVICDFWETVLLGNIVYKGNPMDKHFLLNEKEPLKAEYFERWLKLWKETIDENYSGPGAVEAKSRATNIAGIMKFKMNP